MAARVCRKTVKEKLWRELNTAGHNKFHLWIFCILWHTASWYFRKQRMLNLRFEKRYHGFTFTVFTEWLNYLHSSLFLINEYHIFTFYEKWLFGIFGNTHVYFFISKWDITGLCFYTKLPRFFNKRISYFTS